MINYVTVFLCFIFNGGKKRNCSSFLSVFKQFKESQKTGSFVVELETSKQKSKQNVQHIKN